MFGNPLRAFSTKFVIERCKWPRVMNSGMVITKRIGQSAYLLPNGDKLAYGRVSQTERVLVIVIKGISTPRWLKVQSGS